MIITLRIEDRKVLAFSTLKLTCKKLGFKYNTLSKKKFPIIWGNWCLIKINVEKCSYNTNKVKAYKEAI